MRALCVAGACVPVSASRGTLVVDWVRRSRPSGRIQGIPAGVSLFPMSTVWQEAGSGNSFRTDSNASGSRSGSGSQRRGLRGS